MGDIGSDLSVVFLDLDGTLLDDNLAFKEAVIATSNVLYRVLHGLDHDKLEAAYNAASNRVWDPAVVSERQPEGEGLPPGRQMRLAVWGEVLASCDISDRAVALQVEKVYSIEIKKHYRLFPDAQALLRALKGRFKLGMVSNGLSDVQREKIVATSLEEYIDLILISSEVGFAKPNPAIFQKGLELFGVTSANAIHVGDNILSDVGGALAAGIRSVWVNRHHLPRPEGAPEPDMEVTSLLELEPFLVQPNKRRTYR